MNAKNAFLAAVFFMGSSAFAIDLSRLYEQHNKRELEPGKQIETKMGRFQKVFLKGHDKVILRAFPTCMLHTKLLLT